MTDEARDAMFKKVKDQTIKNLVEKNSKPCKVSDEVEVSFTDKNWNKGKDWMRDENYSRIVPGISTKTLEGLAEIQDMIRETGRIVTEIKDTKLEKALPEIR